MKLTNTQLELLSAAAQRDDRAIELPANLKGGAARKVVAKLLTEGLFEEIQARDSLPVWRQDVSAGSFALRITQNGLKTIKTDDATNAKTKVAASSKRAGRTKLPRARKNAKLSKPGRAKKPRQAAMNRKPLRPRTESKQATVIAMLTATKGAAIPAIVKATGWQQHSVRGFFAGVVRKKLGLNLVSEKSDGERTYRIVQGGRSGGTAVKSKRRGS